MSKNYIHFNILFPSTLDNIELSKAVQDRFVELCGAHLRITGNHLVPPASLDVDMKRWREMAVRHASGNMQNTEAELRSVKTIAQWLVDTNLALRNQKLKKVEWKD